MPRRSTPTATPPKRRRARRNATTCWYTPPGSGTCTPAANRDNPPLSRASRRLLRDTAERLAASGPDEDAGGVGRERRRVRAERVPHAVALQVHLDVRDVERRHGRAVLLQPGAERPQ